MRVRIFARVVVVALISGARVAAAAFAPELELTHAWSVEGPGRFDASGLAIRDGKFFLVTDRHQDTIFELAFDGDVARARPTVTFSLPQPLPEAGYLDNEGLALAADGGFYVVSEVAFAIYHVGPRGGSAMWVTPNLYAAGETVGLFATKDAYLEGVAVLGEGWFLFAVERGPRGLIEVRGSSPPSAQNMEASRYPRVGARKLDFGDLCVWRGRVFALARNQHLVVEIRRDPTGAWAEGDAWSYAKSENAPTSSLR